MKESTYVMCVDPKATKIDIKKSILELYGIEIASVRIVNSRVKMKHGKKKMQIKRRTFKKAYVTLKDKSQKLDLISIK
jgi:ribosomal protein L23